MSFCLLFVGRAAGEDAGFGEQRFEVVGGGDEFDALVGEDLGDCAEQHVGVARAQVEQKLGEPPVGTDGGEDLRVLDLAGHHGAGDALGLEGFDETGELAERHPVDADGGVGGGAGVHLGIGLFLDGGDDDGEAMGARGIEQQEREAPVAGDEA